MENSSRSNLQSLLTPPQPSPADLHIYRPVNARCNHRAPSPGLAGAGGPRRRMAGLATWLLRVAYGVRTYPPQHGVCKEGQLVLHSVCSHAHRDEPFRLRVARGCRSAVSLGWAWRCCTSSRKSWCVWDNAPPWPGASQARS